MNVQQRIFLLSPASCGGRRAQILMRDRAEFPLAKSLRSKQGVPLADVFSFLSGLYFRGKITYARKFSRCPQGTTGAYVITAGRGLMAADKRIRKSDLLGLADVPIDADEPRYRDPLTRDVTALSAQLPDSGQVVLLGSIATDKYVQILSAILGDRLVFPREFIGRGDMSRGGLMLRCAEEGRELEYIPIQGAVRRGTRPEKLPKRVYSK